MKKTYYITAGLLSLVLGFQFAHATSNFTGDAYAEIFGTVLMSDPDDPSSPSYEVTIGDIEADECNYDTQTCNLGGFSWSDVTGWTIWDGEQLQSELGGVKKFPDGYIAKASYRGNIGGFIWGEKYGWVQLSACTGITSQSICNSKEYCQWNATSPGSCEVNQENGLTGDIGTQNVDDWGVYIDFCPVKNETECSSASHCEWNTDDRCVFDGDPSKGHPLRGYALSEKLGWIKFGSDSGETEFDGVFTTWFPDLTPPEFRVANPDNTWIPANNPNTSALIWEDFARDNDSALGVYFADSFFRVNKDTEAQFDDCSTTQDFLDANTPSISPNSNPASNPDLVGAVDLLLPMLTEVNMPTNGFCKYTLGGVLYNGSGFGLYVGPEGKQKAMNDWNWDGSDEDEILPNVLYEDPISLFVRAGEYNADNSLITFTDYSDSPSTATVLAQAVADGENYTTLRFQPKDISGNPIVDVKANLAGTITATEGNWVRNVSMDFIYGNEGVNMPVAFTNDSIDKFRFFGTGLSTPFSVNGVNAPYETGAEIDYPYSTGPNNVIPASDGSYYADTIAYAPYVVSDNKLDMERIDLLLDDWEIPAISDSSSPLDTSLNENVLAAADIHTFDFAPALNTSGNLSTDILVMGSSSTAEYTINNLSSSTEISDYAIDHIMSFSGAESALMEIQGIDLVSPIDSNADIGRTNPDSSSARYIVLKNGSLQDAQDTAFHSATSTYHSPSYPMNWFDSDGLDSYGVFEVDGTSYSSSNDPCRETASCPAMEIDRNDIINKDLIAEGTADYSFKFQAAQIGGQSISGSNTFTAEQYLAYSTEAIDNVLPGIMNIYEGGAVLGPFEMKAIGIGTSGITSGDQIYETVGGRDLETITTTSSADLRKEIRRNVAILTRTMAACSSNSILQTSGELPSSGSSCIQVDEANKTIIAYYSGSGVVRLGTTGPISVPDDYKYTIILDNGADLSIENNILYNDDDNSLGIILLSDSSDNGANVYIHPNPTNLVGLLYAEGSILASPDAGNTFYYNGANSTADLKNQLYWQGSIASKNTIGGAANNNTPEDVDCSDWSDGQSCAQAYDLDFLRRFVTLTKDGLTYAPSNYIYSGGGSCCSGGVCEAEPLVNPNCTNPSLPSTISISSGAIDLINSKSTDTIFIERDNRPVPPGFTSSGGLTSSQEIR
jgi:hypothetical protein